MKPKVICIFGFIATGKFTIGEQVSKQLNMRFFHNHLLIDFVDSLFDRNSKERFRLVEEFRNKALMESVLAGNSCVMTHAYASGFTSPTGLNDYDYLIELESRITQSGGELYGIHLVCDDDIALGRVGSESRQKYMKVTDESVMQGIIDLHLGQETPPLKNILVVDTGKISAKESVGKVINFIEKK